MPPIGSVILPQPQLKLIFRAAQQRPISSSSEPLAIIRMHDRSKVIAQPLVEAKAAICERRSVCIQALMPRSEFTNHLWGEIQRLQQFHLTIAQRACEDLVLRDVDPGSDEPLGHPAVCYWHADTPDVTSRLVPTHNPLRKIESATLRRHRPNFRR